GRTGLRRRRGPPDGRAAADALHPGRQEGLLQQALRRLSMGMFDFLRAKKNTASIAKDRLRIIIAQERSIHGGPDYLPLLRRELLGVIRKYVNVGVEAVEVGRCRGGGRGVPDISVSRPDGRAATA